jgi:hypothetical protein
MNYMPTVMMSQAVPYLDVRFCLERASADDALTGPSQLRFLLGSSLQNNVDPSKPLGLNQIMFMGSVSPSPIATRKITGETTAVNNRQTDKSQQTYLTTGMELFTMPQTLINMDYDQAATPNYNPVINPTAPFGSILSFTVNVVPSLGLMSFKTATLVLKVSDRSRLVEIADFINPKLYQGTTVWVTYGWRAPTQSDKDADANLYHKFINNNMMKREAYGIRNSSVSIDNSGVASVTLSLFTKGSAELVEISPIAATSTVNDTFTMIEEKMKIIRETAARLGLQGITPGAKDVRGYQLIGSASENRFPDLDAAAIDKEIKSLAEALKGNSSPDVTKLIESIKAVFKKDVRNPKSKSAGVENAEMAAKKLAEARFTPLKDPTSADLFTVSSQKKFDKDNNDSSRKTQLHPFTKIISQKGVVVPSKNNDAFGDVSFGRLFFTYFANATKAMNSQTPLIDEYQIIFYNINEYAGRARCINIAEFPIDTTTLVEAYSKRVTEQKGENMTLVNFLEIVRDSQFSDIRHKAYGFSGLYQKNKDNGEFVLKDSSGAELNSATYKNEGAAGPFTLPVIDFYIETGYLTGDSTNADLLQSYEIASVTASSKKIAADQTRIMRIHIFDKASTPHKVAADLLKTGDGNFVEVDSNYRDSFYRQSLQTSREIFASNNNKNKNPSNNPQLKDELTRATQELTNDAVNSNSYTRRVSFKDASGKNPSFDAVKKEIARFTPTITIGSNGTSVNAVNYSTAQDALLSTIMMLRNNTNATSPSQPNGSGANDLPLRVVPGQLSLTTLGCPLVEYMQQYFIDLGTGTTIDNLYSLTGITHTIQSGKFNTELKFTFSDAYGKYESAQTITDGISSTLKKIQDAAVNRTAATTTSKPR